MFTAFTLAMLVYKAQDAVFTTDSDTILDPPALRQMSYVLGSDPDIAGVTGDVKIWNKNESWLALMCALRYWFAVSGYCILMSLSGEWSLTDGAMLSSILNVLAKVTIDA